MRSYLVFSSLITNTYWIHLIHSSFSSSVEADILYTVCFPSTTWAKIGVNICDLILLS